MQKQVHDYTQCPTSLLRLRRGREQEEAPSSPRSASAAAHQRAEILAAVERVRERAAGLVAAAAALPQGFRPAPGELVVDEALAQRLTAEGVMSALNGFKLHAAWPWLELAMGRCPGHCGLRVPLFGRTVLTCMQPWRQGRLA